MILTVGTTPALARSMTFANLVIGDVNRALGVRVNAAGKAVNVARVAATLGERVVAVGFAGGPSGTELLVDIATVGIDARFVQTIASTRVCVTVINQESGQTTELIEEANAVTPAEINAFLDQVHRQPCDILVCSGSLAPGVPANIYKQCIDGFAGGTRPITIVDAKGDALRAAAGCRRVILKCNRAEFAETFGGDDFAKALRPLMDASENNDDIVRAVITDGTRPTTVVDRSGVMTIPTPRVPVVSPIGSGDSVAAGLAVGLHRGMPFIEAAKLGVACGAANAQTPVAGEIDPAEVRKLFDAL